jgi:hypothetical protein
MRIPGAPGRAAITGLAVALWSIATAAIPLPAMAWYAAGCLSGRFTRLAVAPGW